MIRSCRANLDFTGGCPYSANSRDQPRFTNRSEAEFMQYRRCVGSGPSSNKCPRCASHSVHDTAVRTMPKVVSLFSVTFSAAIGAQKLGQPVPESNLVAESNSALSQQMQR